MFVGSFYIYFWFIGGYMFDYQNRNQIQQGNATNQIQGYLLGLPESYLRDEWWRMSVLPRNILQERQNNRGGNMSVFKIVYDPETGAIEETAIKTVEGMPALKDIGKVIVYTKADSLTPAINSAISLVCRDRSEEIELIAMIIDMVNDLLTQHREARRVFSSIYSQRLRELEKEDGSPFYEKSPFVVMSHLFSEIDFLVDNSIMGRLQWLLKATKGVPGYKKQEKI